MEKENTKQYIYIVQSLHETTTCKIGKTNDLERRLKEYNNMTGKSKENVSRYLFTCEVQDMTQVETDIKEKFSYLREDKKREIYLFTSDILKMYVEFLKLHSLFVEEIFTQTTDKQEVKIKYIKKVTPSLKEQGITTVDVMNKAKKSKYDEFYTRYEDVEKELSMYDKDIWKDKCVFCNCDDAVDTDERRTSAFALYFLRNFKELDLKKLICTHYGGGIDIFNQGTKGYIFTYIFTKNGFEGKKNAPKGYDGSFDHPISLKILNEEADIVCTNPPFSIARDYWKTVIESGKQFLIISNITNAKNQPYISYFMENKVWAGYNEVDWYQNHRRELVRAAGFWFTNIPVKNRPKYKQLKIIPLKDIPDKYKKYDDLGTLLVENNYIPNNYKHSFAVSVRQILNGLLEKGYKYVQDKDYTPYIDGKAKFGRVLVQKIENTN